MGTEDTASRGLPQGGEELEHEPLREAPACQVSGRLIRSDGQPIRSFTINGSPFDSPDGTFRRGFDSKDGEGPPHLEIFAPGFLGRWQRYDPWKSAEVDLGELVLEEARSIRVQVVDADSGLPVGDATLELQDGGHERVPGFSEEPLHRIPLIRSEGGCFQVTAPRHSITVTAWCRGYVKASAVLSQ
jgi:hypothetical protein